jgi:hypothetical protein
MRIKKCIKCSEQFESAKMGNICKACVRATAKAWYYKNKEEGTLKYQKRKPRIFPLQNDRYNELAEVKRGLKQCNTREERRAFYVMMLERIRNNKPLWEYIIRFGDNHVPVTNQGKNKQLKNEDI